MKLTKTTLGPVLRRLRKMAGLTQVQLGKIVGLSSGGMSKLETGERDTTTKVLLTWVEVCGHELEVSGTKPDGSRLDVSHLSASDRDLAAVFVDRLADLEPVQKALLVAQIEVLRGLVPTDDSNGCQEDVKTGRRKTG